MVSNQTTHKNTTSSSFTFIYLVLLLTFAQPVFTDNPVHCQRHQIAGDWIFRVNSDIFQPSLKDEKTHCGHGFPHKIETYIGNKEFKFDHYKDVKLTLHNNSTVTDENGELAGNWTAVYDQGMIVQFKGALFTTFSKYYKNKESDKDYVSDCSQTMIGWFQSSVNERGKDWSCFFGFKKNAGFLQKKLINQENKVSFIQFENEDNFLGRLIYDDHQEIVDAINESGLTWKAELYENFKGKSFLQIKKFMTSNKSKAQLKKGVIPSNVIVNLTQNENENESDSELLREADSYHIRDYIEVVKYWNTSINDIPDEVLPRNWDWRNVSNISYVHEPRNQGDCGSCYAISTMGSLESRLRIITNNTDQTRFSPQFPVSCSFYTEGCDGGYPILVGKFLKDFEIIPESCMKYGAEKGKIPKCSDLCDTDKLEDKYTISDIGFLGGFYGNSSEADIVKEIRARGPLVANMRLPSSFSFYKSGIFIDDDIPAILSEKNGLNHTTLYDLNRSWDEVSHSVLFVGFGEENGIKYWIVQNSWGSNWGDNGYFKVLRGQNHLAIESMGDYFNIKKEKRTKNSNKN